MRQHAAPSRPWAARATDDISLSTPRRRQTVLEALSAAFREPRCPDVPTRCDYRNPDQQLSPRLVASAGKEERDSRRWAPCVLATPSGAAAGASPPVQCLLTAVLRYSPVQLYRQTPWTPTTSRGRGAGSRGARSGCIAERSRGEVRRTTRALRIPSICAALMAIIIGMHQQYNCALLSAPRVRRQSRRRRR